MLHHITRFQEQSFDYSLFTDAEESLLTPDLNFNGQQFFWSVYIGLLCLNNACKKLMYQVYEAQLTEPI